MDKQFVMRTFREAHDSFDLASKADDKYAQIGLGMEQLCEALTRAIDDSTRSHAPIILDAAYKRLFNAATEIGGQTEVQMYGGACMLLTAALKMMLFDKPPARPY